MCFLNQTVVITRRDPQGREHRRCHLFSAPRTWSRTRSGPVSKGLTHGISRLRWDFSNMTGPTLFQRVWPMASPSSKFRPCGWPRSTKEKAPLRFLKYDGSGRHDRLKHVSKGIVQTTRTRHLDQITDDNTINDVIATSWRTSWSDVRYWSSWGTPILDQKWFVLLYRNNFSPLSSQKKSIFEHPQEKKSHLKKMFLPISY